MAKYTLSDLTDLVKNRKRDIKRRKPAYPTRNITSAGSPGGSVPAPARYIPENIRAGYQPRSAAPAGKPPEKTEKKKSNWRAGLSAALQGASAAIEANVGPGQPGQEFRQGVLRGVVGAGKASAAEARRNALREQSGAGLRDKLALLAAKKAGEPKEPSWEEKNIITSRQAMNRVIASNTESEKRAKRAAAERTSGKTEAQLAALRVTAYKQAFNELLKEGEETTPKNVIPRFNKIYELLLSPRPKWGSVPGPG